MDFDILQKYAVVLCYKSKNELTNTLIEQIVLLKISLFQLNLQKSYLK